MTHLLFMLVAKYSSVLLRMLFAEWTVLEHVLTCFACISYALEKSLGNGKVREQQNKEIKFVFT